MPLNKQNQRLVGPGSRYSQNDEEILNQFDEHGYGLRPNGTPKGQGWLGPLPMTDNSGKIATELTIGVDGEDIPLLVPTLTQDEIDHLLSGGSPTREMVDKAVGFSHERRQKGLSVYADPIAWKEEMLTSKKKAYGGRGGTRYFQTPDVGTSSSIRNFQPDPSGDAIDMDAMEIQKYRERFKRQGVRL